ncbi:MAG: vanadium-dependent haloperoxidase [Nitrospirales bacterium]|nr:vanadium-dependent haloperoxidase [Nitrospirales bacterium]
MASYSKGLPHNALGEVDISAYDKMVQALQSGRSADFEIIPMGEANPAKRRKLVNPQSGLAFDYAGADSHHLSQPPAPLFSSAEQAGEMVENYWMALTRDISFTEYDSHPLTTAAVNDLTTLTDFRGPKIGGTVTTKTLFRGLTPGDLMGPYLSQFLLKAAKFGAEIIDQRIQTTEAGKDFMTQYADWLQVQRGTKQPDNIFDPILRYIRNGRDAGQYVHIDVLFQGYFDACLILAAPVTSDPATSGYGVPCNPGNPYVNSLTQEGFGTFGPPHIKGVLGEVAVQALKAVWYQKWFVHRLLRPEVFAGRIHNHKTGAASYPIHSDVLNSDALQRIYDMSGKTSYLLPMAFTEGSPLHPSYGAGHATVAGACVTILKWFFDESFPIQSPMEANPDMIHLDQDGTTLRPYLGADKDQLTVGGELNKLASNIGISRNISGVHWRSDLAQSLVLGEEVAIRTLIDFRESVAEDFDGCTFTKFDGTEITV